MDKYQSNLFNKIKNISLTSPLGDGKVEYNENEFILIQNENYNILKYTLVVDNLLIEKISVDGIEFNNKVIIDFNKKINEITFFFRNSLAEPLTFKAVYIYANKDNYDNKIALAKKEKMLMELSPQIRMGNGVINIHWKSVSDDYNFMRLTIYAIIDTKEMIMEKITIQNGIFYQPLNNLAFGEYKVLMEVFDKTNTIIISTFLNFYIRDEYSLLLNEIKNKIGFVSTKIR